MLAVVCVAKSEEREVARGRKNAKSVMWLHCMLMLCILDVLPDCWLVDKNSNNIVYAAT